MKTEIAGITRANEGMQGISWNILGQTYVPKNVTEHSFSWHATFPPDTFVPPHIHPDQDEYLYILEGKLDFFLDGADTQATPGDLVRLPMGKPHGIFNKSGRTAKVLFWVSPTPAALRSVLEHPQYEGTDAGSRGGAGGRAQHPLPAAAPGGVSRRIASCAGWSAAANHEVSRSQLALSRDDRFAPSGLTEFVLTPAPPPARAAAAQSRPWRRSRARSLRAGRSSAPSRYR